MYDLDQLLDSSLGNAGENSSDADLIPVVEIEDGQIDPRYTRLSYSGIQSLHACPRFFQLQKLNAEATEDVRTNVTFAFGKAVGVGLQEYLITKDWNHTLLQMFLEWDTDYLAENDKQKKSFQRAVLALQIFKGLVDDGVFDAYEVAKYNGKPASELSFRITFPGHFAEYTLRGYLDLVLRNVYTDEHAVMENKTSSGTWVNHVQYKNSAQGVGYSTVLDKISQSTSYAVMYYVYMTKLERFEDFEFPKTMQQRALWLRDVMWDIQKIEGLVATEGNYGIWPMHGESCYRFGRPCEYLDICHMDTRNLMRPLRQNQLQELDSEGNPKVYDFELTLEELL